MGVNYKLDAMQDGAGGKLYTVDQSSCASTHAPGGNVFVQVT